MGQNTIMFIGVLTRNRTIALYAHPQQNGQNHFNFCLKNLKDFHRSYWRSKSTGMKSIRQIMGRERENEQKTRTATFVAAVDQGRRITFVFARCRYLSIFGISLPVCYLIIK